VPLTHLRSGVAAVAYALSSYVELDGIKLTMNLAFVAVYKASKGAATSIDIVRCGAFR